MRTKFALQVSVLFLTTCFVGCTSDEPPPVAQSQSAAASSSKVEGFSANALLVEQGDKHEETMRALADAQKRGDMDSFRRILRLRSIELDKALADVSTGSYSISDKNKIANILQQEKDWVEASLVTMAQ
jgi:hypothetical protein